MPPLCFSEDYVHASFSPPTLPPLKAELYGIFLVINEYPYSHEDCHQDNVGDQSCDHHLSKCLNHIQFSVEDKMS